MSTEQSKTDNHARPSRFTPRNWRVPTRLTALIIAPTLVAVLLAGVRVVGSIDSINAYGRIRQAAEYSVRLRDLAQQLALERDLTVWGGPRRKFNVDGQTELTRADQRAVVDPLVHQVTTDLKNLDPAFGVRAVEQAEQAVNRIASLPGIRANGAPEDYSALIANILRLQDELGQNGDDPQVVGDFHALGGIAHAKEEVALQRSMLARELLERSEIYTPNELKDFLASQSRQQSYLATFYTEAPPLEAGRLVTLLGDKDIVDTELTKSWALTLGIQGVSLGRYRDRDRILQRWFQHSTKAVEQMAVVEHRVSATVLDRAGGLQSSEQRNALIAGALILALLLLVLATTVLIARSMVRPLRRLRAEALEIAGLRLPEVVRRMRQSDEVQEPQVKPIGVGSADEIGEVAQAFDEVHRQAVRLAAEESRLRANVNAMFVNLSRRTQTLVERQISLIDGLERGEEDGGRLADLFKLDHLATRMRRNSENLLVLAGHEPARKRSQPARLVDVVRASLSEVEDYERVTVKVHRSIAVAGHAANDVVHLVAELVENAIAFSPRNTKVLVSSSPVEGGAVMLGVSDAGIGMSLEELAETNRRLAEPPTVDVSVSRRMGLFVVGRLALRHGIRVQLRAGDGSGVIAMVLFPADLVSNADQPAPSPAAPVPPPRAAFGDPASGAAPSPTGSFQPWGAPSQQEPPDSPGGFSPWNPSSPAPATNGLPTRRPSTPRQNGAWGSDGAESANGGNRSNGAHPAGVAGSDGGFAPFGAPTQDATESFPAYTESPTGPSAFPDRPVAPAAGMFPFGEPTGRSPLGQPAARPAFGEPTAGPSAFGEPPAAQSPFGEPPAGPSAFGEPPAARSPYGEPSLFNEPPGGRPPFSEPSPFGEQPVFTEHSGAFPIGEAAVTTGPLPVVTDSPLERGDEYLPIFASVESAWFRRPADEAEAAGQVAGLAAGQGETSMPDAAASRAPGSGQAPSGQAAAGQVPAGAPGGGDRSRAGQAEGAWGSQADSGFQAAATVKDPSLGGVTAAGLPKRTPKANLVPGSVGTAGAAAAPRPPVSAEAVRNRLSSFQQGVRRGRADLAGGSVEGSGNEEDGS
ncbi:nitrate- and nitrite sensing domain-containing protein [Planotetraspora sp. A-T 1434]|uniref:sensor histidine kinase n=1 Tax=Planotetraspora sp. A-T 1434 TaxID=2979219 RepID=UPI0021C16CD4|nr:nitrate- and nitrite sensing domain-containing protein [Planotetraspora sp. A-T 1434]MCT9929182.1 nitrate- and nitrite sensing domain-containing protein [Planotetraspora sp. A-T 1434]